MSLLRSSLLLALAACAAAPAAHAARGFEIRDLAKLDRYSSPVLAADGKTVVYARRVVDFAANKGSTALWVQDTGAKTPSPRRLTPEGWNVNSPALSNDGKTVYFLSGKSGTQQLYAIPLTGGTPKALTDLPLDVGAFKFSPDGSRIALGLETYADCKSDLACTKRLLDEIGRAHV